MAHGKIDDSKDGPVYLGFIPEKAARITVVLLLLLAIATYAFGVEVFFKTLFALVVCWLSGLFGFWWRWSWLGFAWVPLNSINSLNATTVRQRSVVFS